MSVLELRGTSDLVQLPLKRKGPMIEKMTANNEPPRALRSLAQIIENDLCHRCGSCIGICPTGVLGVDSEEFPVVKNLSACTDCDLCVKVCPGDEFNVPQFTEELYPEKPDIKDVYGSFINGYLSHSTDPVIREKSTSGGFVSALLMSLIENGEIDGALVIAADPETKFKGIPKIARTKEEIFAATKSKYAIVPTNTALKEIREVPGRYAIVGLPCQIHGYHKAKELDKRIKERVVLTIGLLCHAAIEHDPLKLLFENLGDEKKEVERFIYRVEKHPGSSYAVMKDGRYVPVLFPKAKGYQPTAIEMMNILYRLYTPMRCMTCYDSMVEFADIAVGDPWMPTPSSEIDFYKGFSYLITRSERGEKMLHKAHQAGALNLLKLSRESAKTSNYAMGSEKRRRAFRLLETRKRQGLPVPNYGFDIPKFPIKGNLKHFLETEINLITHIFCFSKKYRDLVLKFWLSPVGYGILKVNNVRRHIRTIMRNRKAEKMRREGKLAGVIEMKREEVQQW
ncbi:MAG: Coenzyme F420 hydrogenase/dehydrogenase, beta subunit C-terminal domain [Proteobacteria bacterium]|nr:Coenzyme F420 hydrogenase/dehydrogenase, beta subunit C-terminal domain [Pseudomonadota bacterium]